MHPNCCLYSSLQILVHKRVLIQISKNKEFMYVFCVRFCMRLYTLIWWLFDKKKWFKMMVLIQIERKQLFIHFPTCFDKVSITEVPKNDFKIDLVHLIIAQIMSNCYLSCFLFEQKKSYTVHTVQIWIFFVFDFFL